MPFLAQPSEIFMRSLPLIIIIFLMASPVGADTESQREILRDAVFILEEILNSPDYNIPSNLLSKAEAVVIFPTMIKGGFIFAARYGRGVAAARLYKTGEWGAPSFVATVGGSVGFQAGAEAVDLVLLIMNRRGIEALLENKYDSVFASHYV